MNDTYSTSAKARGNIDDADTAQETESRKHSSHSLVVIVLVYNSADDAIICVNQLLGFGADFRIVIVDNCSPDGSYVRLQETYADRENVDVIITDANRGYSAGNNFGIRHALRHYEFDTIAIMNPDVVIPQKSVLDNLMRLLWLYDDCIIVGGQALNHLDDDKPWQSAWSIPTDREIVRNHSVRHRGTRRNDATRITKTVYAVDCIAGCFFLAKIVPFAQLGLFDENVFLYNEENIIGIKCRRAGYRLLMDTSQTYYHNHARNVVRKATLRSRLAAQKAGYESRRYLACTYYSPSLRFPLWRVEKTNELTTLLGWVRHDMLRRRHGR